MTWLNSLVLFCPYQRTHEDWRCGSALRCVVLRCVVLRVALCCVVLRCVIRENKRRRCVS